MVMLLPTSPIAFEPQQCTLPEDVRAHVCANPVATWTTLVMLVKENGVVMSVAPPLPTAP